ncbi:MAG: hypothetical protein KDK39_13060, partial [Leptospiraceae bacterium]|nr:hypothetical protein [Leptospiraceae bacterium]
MILFTSLAGGPLLLAEENKDLPDPKVKVKLGVYSNYISKGKDVFSDRAIQKKKAYGANTGAPLFRPEVTVNLPEP